MSSSSALAFVALSLAPCQAWAFGLRGHLYVADETLRALDAGGGTSVEIDGLGSLPLMNDEAALAVRRFPAYFRAGSLGPDVFPDPVVGRSDGHADKGNRAGLDLEQCRATPGCVPGGVPFEERTFAQWRPVDYGMLLLRRASRYRRGERTPGAIDERLQAVAFAYGYLGHVAADGFGEAWVREWAGTDTDALFGAPAATLRRLAVERYVDAQLPGAVAADDTTVSIPAAFLAELYRSELTTTDGPAKAAPAGSLGGEYLVRLLELRATFGDLADSSGWRHLGRKHWPKDVVSLLALLEATGGSRDPGRDPVREIEGFFESRRTVVDEVIDGWIRLSGCVAQNLARGAARTGAPPLREDACAGAYEAGPGVAEVFRGELDRAAHHGADDARADLGAPAPNLEKQRRFVTAINARVLELGDGAAAGLDATVCQAVLRRVIQPRAATLEASLQATYLGPFAVALVGAHDDAARLRRADDGRALVRLAFLAGDLRRDAGYAGRLIGGIAGTPCADVDPARPLGPAVDACYERTVSRGVARLRSVVVPAWGTYETAWRGLVELVLRLAVDPASVTGERLRDPAWGWLSQLRFRDPSRSADSAVGQLVSLLDVLEGLSAVAAPTEQALHRELAPGSDAAPFDGNAFYPLRNALVVNRLGLLGRGGLEGLGKVAGLSLVPFGFSEAAFAGTPGAAARHRPSQICAAVPHVVCDAPPGLDDPNARGRTPVRASGLQSPEGVDPERSLAIWRAAADPRAPGACELGLTSFLLAGRVETVRRIYGRVFTYPPRCRAAAVIVESIAHEPPAVEPGNEVTVGVTVANVGQLPATATTLEVNLAGRPLATHAIPALDPGQALELVEKVRVAAEGELEVTATLGASGEVQRHTVVVSEVPDLAVSLRHSGPGLDGTLTFTATVRNLGKGKAAASTLLFKTPAAPDGAEHVVPALAPGASFDVAWSTVAILRVYAVSAVGDAKGAVPERDRTNNEASDWVDLARERAVFAQYLGRDAGVVATFEHTFLRGSWLSVGVGGRPSVALVPVTASILLPLLDRSWDIELEVGVGVVVSYVAGDVAHGAFRAGLGISGMVVAGARIVLGDFRVRATYSPTYCYQGPGARELVSLGAGWVF